MLHAHLQSVTRYRRSRSLHPAPGMFISATRFNYFFLLGLKELSYSDNNVQQQTACVTGPCQGNKQDANSATSEAPFERGKEFRATRTHKKPKKKEKNILHILSTKTFSQWLPKLRGLCAALLIFFCSSVREMAPRKWGLARRFMSCHS